MANKKKIKPTKKGEGRRAKGLAKSKPSALRSTLYALKQWFFRRRLWQQIGIGFLVLLTLWIGLCYGISRWYAESVDDQPQRLGVTFIPTYAQFLGVGPQETMNALVKDLGIRQFRLVSYWNEYEKQPGQYNFEQLDWQFRLAEESGSKVSLAIGLRQPRWPECHMPEWAAALPKGEWSARLKDYMKVVIERYKSSPALESYQLENEFFMKVFGICPDHTRERLVDEFNFVKSLDSEHPVIISRSNNAVGLPLYAPTPDIFGVSVYKRVWDKSITKRYFEYPFPAWFYGFLAGVQKIVIGQDMIVHELQAESWLPPGYEMNNPAHVPEQNKSLNDKRLRDRIKYGKATGMRDVYMWGAEWWYWRKQVANDPSLWQVVKEEVIKTEAQNAENSY